MSLRSKFVTHCSPVGVTGTTLRDWLRILAQNRFAIPPRYWVRVCVTTCNSTANSIWKLVEDLRYSRRLARTTVAPPLIILGAPRSGTTHLHNLLARDDRFAFPNTAQVLYPHTFLTTEPFNRRALNFFMDPERPMDNVFNGAGEPQEDEYVMAARGLSFTLEWCFWRTGAGYRRFLTLDEASPEEVERWKFELMRFLRKLTLKYQRPLVLKSPGHTCRIRLFLDMFPQAKFVHIRRNPYDVYRSTVHTAGKAGPFWAYQEVRVDTERIMDDYMDTYNAFFEQRPLIPEGNFCEVAYEQLEKQPLVELERIYETLGLPDFAEAKPRLQEYLSTIADYKKNSHATLPAETRQRLSDRWARCFDAWGYEKEGTADER